MIAVGAEIFPRSTVLELTIGGAELAELHRKRAALFRDMAKRSAAKLEAPPRPSSRQHMHAHGPELVAAAASYDRGQRRFHIAQLERSADALELIAGKIEPDRDYVVGDDLIQHLAGPIAHVAPFGLEDEDDPDDPPQGVVRTLRGAS
jgi:hypothetical protein